MCLCLFCKSAKADIEPINIVVKNAVASVEETKKQLNDAYDVANKTATQLTNGFSKAKEGIEKAQEFIEDPVGQLKIVVNSAFQKDDPEETGFEAVQKTKETYSRKKGEKYNITKQKELNKVADKEKFDGISRLFARALTMRLALKEEESEEPDLSTVAAARRATTDKMVNIAKRYNRIFETRSYIDTFNNTILIQNYQIEAEEGDE